MCRKRTDPQMYQICDGHKKGKQANCKARLQDRMPNIRHRRSISR